MTKKSIYELNSDPKISEILPISLQHLLAMLIGNVSPAILIAQAAGLTAQKNQELVSAAMLAAAIATLIQVYSLKSFGSKLPLVMGLNFAFVPVSVMIIKSYGIATLFPAFFIAGFVLIIVGHYIEKIQKYFPPLVTGVTVTSMGISLYPVAMNYMAGGVNTPGFGGLDNWLLAFITLALVIFLQTRKGKVGANAMLIAILISYIIAIFMKKVDFSGIKNASLISFPKIAPFGFKFNLEACITMIFMYIVTSVQTIGDVNSLTIGALERKAEDKEVSSAIKGNGLASLISSLFGGLPTSTFAQNVGITTVTKAVSRKIIKLLGLFILLAAFLPKFSAIMTSIPYPVLGGATLTVFAVITVNGIKLLLETEMNQRNMTIIGISLALGLGVLIAPDSIAEFPEFFKIFFGSSPIIVSTLVAFILNILIKEEEPVAK